MLPRWPLLLSLLGACSLVAGLLAALTLALSDIESPDLTAPLAEQQATPTPADAATGPDPSVCTGLRSRREPGDPRRFSPEHTQVFDVLGIAVVGNSRVDAEAFEVARETLETMFEGNGLAEILAAQGAYIVIASADQGILDIPEFRCLEEERGPNSFDHICGVADHADYPLASVNELDLLGNPRGPCGGLNILFHEAGHLVQNFAIEHADYIDVRIIYQAALDAGKYEREYAATNSREYFAEGTQSYFHHSDLGGGRDHDALRDYDPELFAMLDHIYRP
ncbi:MAG: hypothetical protein WEC33_02535 [Dehalococcoidia bacterium]